MSAEPASMSISIPLPCGCVLRHTVQELPTVADSYCAPEGDAFMSWARTLLGAWFRNHASQHHCPEYK